MLEPQTVDVASFAFATIDMIRCMRMCGRRQGMASDKTVRDTLRASLALVCSTYVCLCAHYLICIFPFDQRRMKSKVIAADMHIQRGAHGGCGRTSECLMNWKQSQAAERFCLCAPPTHATNDFRLCEVREQHFIITLAGPFIDLLIIIFWKSRLCNFVNAPSRYAGRAKKLACFIGAFIYIILLSARLAVNAHFAKVQLSV